MRFLVINAFRWSPIAALMGLTACQECPQCPPPCPDASDPQKVAAVSNCGNGDLGKRSKLYNSTTLDAAKTAFVGHFKAQVGPDLKAIRYVPVYLSIAKLRTQRKQLNPEPAAIMVHYGLDGDEFVPVFEFMAMDANGADVKGMGTYYLSENGELKAPADQRTATNKMDDYKSNIRIHRTDAAGPPTDLRTVAEGYADPTGEWFQFNFELDRLEASNANNANDAFVVNCISEVVCYSALQFLEAEGQGEEYRHMIAWHVNHDGVPHVGSAALDEVRPLGDEYRERAVDLGHLCPPRCK